MPTDVDRLDLVQGFVDVTLPIAGTDRLTLRGGRQEMSFGSSRLVSVRESPNVRRAFDGGRAFWTGSGYRIDALYARPVTIEPGVFDDRTSDREKLWGAYATGPVSRAAGLNADLYYFGYERDAARFTIGTADERRHTIGTRLFGQSGGFDWDVEGAIQFGRFGRAQIRAWTVASDVGFTFVDLPFEPRLGLKADIASGDGDPADGRLGTFNALFPKFPYFSEANLIAPANIIDVQPSMQLQLAPSIRAELGWNALWRQTARDAIYEPPLSAIDGTAGAVGRFIGHQAIVGVQWQATRNIVVQGQYVHFTRGDTLRQAGGTNIDFVFASAAYRF